MTLLNQQQIQKVSSAVEGLNANQLAWVSGYFSGLSANADTGLQHQITDLSTSQTSAQTSPQLHTAEKVTVLYGSQTGNSKKIAESVSAELKTKGADVTLKNLLDYRPQQLKKEQKVVLVISTHGNGEAPDEALAFYNFIYSDRAPKLDNLEFAVLGLGDSSYDDFCQTGVDVDAKFEELGAKRFHDRVDLDLDFEVGAKSWQQEIVSKLDALNDQKTESNDAQHVVIDINSKQAINTAETQSWSEANPYHAEILAITNLTTDDSEQDAYHIEISTEAEGLRYEPGDIIAILPENNTELVDAIIKQLDASETELVTVSGDTSSLRNALTHKLEIANLTAKVVKSYAELVSNEPLNALTADKEQLKQYLHGSDLLDLLQDYPGEIATADLLYILRPLFSRQYSIASSEQVHTEEAHILIKPVYYDHNDRKHLGVSSNWLIDKQAGDTIPVHIKPNSGFSLPESNEDKIIMIGAGTGVAPYRSFLYEREAREAKGNSWLFFGEQRFQSDFLYQTDWQHFLKNGTLEKMNVAFSRDQQEKIYIQDKLLEESAQVFEWIEQGATLYVCGDIDRLAQGVHDTLHKIISKHSGLDDDGVSNYIDQLKINKKYQRDVY
ncbi:assimilatory sulfite reductase (NADPH) flavoprotein subunit [Cocleimonas flava]|uniref:Sulfite reductase [NADPH] flavoprotein alpha-component n=1 Tax=Cocleimonas flava TaxID=634765 RepID=A0A4V2P8W4_9GAMM|nr:assimilatory sulfite reductase (NADPH) flavoprotein subunit [Cocleimonas flava]TCJ87255.1 sulfite reductase (NADPH) alpha subunit [Cocleimonas flava]